MLDLERAAELGHLLRDNGVPEISGPLDLSEAKNLAHRAVELIEDGTVGYTLSTARRKV